MAAKGQAVMEARAKEFVGRSLGPWQVRAVLGSGGMGVVLLGRQGTITRAIKLPRVRDEEFLLRFEREARVLAALGDVPGVVRVHEVLQTELGPAMVMDHIEGESLAERLKAVGAMPEKEACDLVAQLAGTIAALHDRGIWHRDLKPANVLLNPETGAPTLVDFGVAHVNEESLTMTGQALGTLAWMAPEQLAPGRVKPGRACDIWALGVILHECLTGLRPFVGSSSTELIGRIVAGRAELSPELSAATRGLIRACLSVDPTARLTGSALRAGLNQVASGREPRRANRLMAGAVLLLTLSVVGVGIALEVRRRRVASRRAVIERSLRERLAVEEQELDTRLVDHLRRLLLDRSPAVQERMKAFADRVRRVDAASELLRQLDGGGGSGLAGSGLPARVDRLTATVSALTAAQSGDGVAPTPAEGTHPAWQILQALERGEVVAAREMLVDALGSPQKPSGLLEFGLRVALARRSGDADAALARRSGDADAAIATALEAAQRKDGGRKADPERRSLLDAFQEIHRLDDLIRRIKRWDPGERPRAAHHAELAREACEVFSASPDRVRAAARRRLRRLFTELEDRSLAVARARAYLRLRSAGAVGTPEPPELSSTLILGLLELPGIRRGQADPEVSPLQVLPATLEAFRRGLPEPTGRSFARLEEWISEHVWLVHMQTWFAGRSPASETANRLRLLEAFGRAKVWIYIGENYLSSLSGSGRGRQDSLAMRLVEADSLTSQLIEVPHDPGKRGLEGKDRETFKVRLKRLNVLAADQELPKACRVELEAIRPLIEFYAGERTRLSAADALVAGAERKGHPQPHELLWQAARLLRWVDPERAAALIERSHAARRMQGKMSLAERCRGRDRLQPLFCVPPRVELRRTIADQREQVRIRLARLERLGEAPTAATRDRWQALLVELQDQLDQRLSELDDTEIPDRRSSTRETMELLVHVALALNRREAALAAFLKVRGAIGRPHSGPDEKDQTPAQKFESFVQRLKSRPPH